MNAEKRQAMEVNDFMRGLDHVLKPEIELVRSIILEASPAVTEGIKWKSPSFRIKDDFATMNIRKDAVWVIFHQGAKATKASVEGLKISDPTGLLEWLAKDRAVVKFKDVAAIESGRSAFEELVRQWIESLPNQSA